MGQVDLVLVSDKYVILTDIYGYINDVTGKTAMSVKFYGYILTLWKQNCNQFLLAVKATTLKQQISQFYSQVLSTKASYHIYTSSLQTARSTRSSSIVTLARTHTISLKITDRSFQYASPRLCKQVPASFHEPVLRLYAYFNLSFHVVRKWKLKKLTTGKQGNARPTTSKTCLKVWNVVRYLYVQVVKLSF